MSFTAAGGEGGDRGAGGGNSDGGAVFGSAPRDFVRMTADVTSQVRSSLERARKDPAKEIGITAEEIKERRKLASSPRTFVSDKTQRGFDVKSSARAQQIMNKGLLARQRKLRERDALKKMKFLRYVQVGTLFLGAAFLGWFGMTFLLPRYAAVQERSRVLHLRYEMAQRKWEELRLQNEGGDKLGS